MKGLTKINSFLRKRYHVGFLLNYPYRTSTEFVKRKFVGRDIVCVEIGSFRGQNALNMLQKIKNIKKIYLIDPWVEYSDYEDANNGSKNLSDAYLKAKKILKKYKKKVIFIRKFSDDALSDIPEKVDFIYIDGNHGYDFVKKDMLNYWDKLAHSGVMAGHDINLPGVSKAFCEFVNEKGIKNPLISVMDWIAVKE